MLAFIGLHTAAVAAPMQTWLTLTEHGDSEMIVSWADNLSQPNARVDYGKNTILWTECPYRSD